jgi:uncharacterized protein (DUF2336 family)
MMELKAKLDLPAFVQGAILASSEPLSLPWAVGEIDSEVLRTQRSLSRDSHMRFQQILYMNSLNRLLGCLRTCVLPADLTPRERLAFRALSQALSVSTQVPDALAQVLDQVTLPEGMFAIGTALYKSAN